MSTKLYDQSEVREMNYKEISTTESFSSKGKVLYEEHEKPFNYKEIVNPGKFESEKIYDENEKPEAGGHKYICEKLNSLKANRFC